MTQSQSNNLGSPPNSTPSLIVFNSIYENTQDSSGNEIRIRFFNLFKDNQSRFNIDTLQKVLEIEDSNLNSEYSFPDISFRICQKTYSLEIYQGLGFQSPYQLMNSATYNIEDFDVVYDSNCIDRNLLFIKMSFEGYLYEYNRINHTKLDSIYINKSEMELLFKYD